MVKWIICELNEEMRAIPASCNAVGVAYQKTQGDEPNAPGFIRMENFNDWLRQRNMVAFNAAYVSPVPSHWKIESLPLMYNGD